MTTTFMKKIEKDINLHSNLTNFNDSNTNNPGQRINRKDFQIVTSFLDTNDIRKIINLEQLLHESCQLPPKNESLQTLTQKRKDMLSDKFDVGSSVINKESCFANLQTVEYLVKNLVPIQLKTISTKQFEYGNKTNYGEKTFILKSLLSNLSKFLKEIKTEVNILTFLDNLNEKSPKNHEIADSLDEKSIKYEFSLPTLDMKSSTKITIIPPQCPSSKYDCHYDKCKKVYSSHDTLLYHMKTKHKKGDTKKPLYSNGDNHVTQKERRKARNNASDTKIITLKANQKTSDIALKTPEEKIITIKEEKNYYSNPKCNRKNNQSKKKEQKVSEPLSKDDRLLGKKLRSSGGTISISKNLFDKDLQPNLRKKNFVIKNIKVQEQYDTINKLQEKFCDPYYENISTEDTSKNPLIKKLSPTKSCEIDQNNVNLNNNTSKIIASRVV